MRKLRLALLVFTAAFFHFAADIPIAKAATGGYESGNKLLLLCNKGGSSWQHGLCAGYIIGVADAFDDKGPFCLAQGVAMQQIVDIAVQWLRNHPERRQFLASSLVSIALNEKFPCN
jgi:hypothetical protein